MPSLPECDSMIAQQERLARALQHIKKGVLDQMHVRADQHAREQSGKMTSEDYPEEGSMYGDDMKSQGYGSSDAKKRRGVSHSAPFY